jgi:hypothetical protein
MPCDFAAFLRGLEGEEAPAAPLASTSGPESLPAPVAGLPARLEHVVSRSIEQADHILDLPLDRDHPQYAAELRAKTAVINTTLATQVKVDDLRLKHQGDDPKVLERLLEEIREAKAKNPMLCEPPVRQL